MSDAEFAALPGKVVPRTQRLVDPDLRSSEAAEFILGGYCRKFFEDNKPLQEHLAQFGGRFDDPACQAGLTPGQRLLHSLAALDGEVRNGGLAQFFWNCPDLVFGVGRHLRALGESALADAYDKALESLVGRQSDWLRLREQSNRDPAAFWEPFQETYELLDLGDFDDAYFDTHGPALVIRLVNYVRTHREEFIEP